MGRASAGTFRKAHFSGKAIPWLMSLRGLWALNITECYWLMNTRRYNSTVWKVIKLLRHLWMLLMTFLKGGGVCMHITKQWFCFMYTSHTHVQTHLCFYIYCDHCMCDIELLKHLYAEHKHYCIKETV